MNRITIGSALMSVTIVAASAGQPAPAVPQSAAHNEGFINNAVVMTVTHGNIQNGSVHIKDGKIAAVGPNLKAPAGATVIDAGGKYLTPGIIDSHSHIALDDDVNEATSPVTPQMMMIDAFDYQDKAIYRGLAGVLRGKLLVQIHCYRADELLTEMEIAKEFGYKVRAFHHALEAYKVADKLAANDVAIATFADWWGYKNEAWDAIPWNAVISMRKGVRVAIKSDSDDLARRLNQEAAKTMRYGGATEEEALRMITLNPAWIIGVENRVGSIEVGKDADLVIWDGYPLSSYGVPDKVLIDGDVYFDRSLPGFGMPGYKEGE